MPVMVVDPGFRCVNFFADHAGSRAALTWCAVVSLGENLAVDESRVLAVIHAHGRRFKQGRHLDGSAP